MNKRVIVFAALLFAFGMIAASSGEDISQALMKLENDWAKAALAGDTAALENILAPNYIFTSPEGEMVTRADQMAALKSGQMKYEVFTVEDMKVYQYGDAAVVTGKGKVKGTEMGKPLDEEDRFTDTWVKMNGKWMAVATHASRISKM